MLKYFGLKEILYGFKRFLVIIIAVTIAFGAVGFVLAGNNDVYPGSSDIYYSSCSYLVTAQLKESEQSQSESDIATANTVSSMLMSDFAKQYVMEKIVEQYPVKEVLKYTGAQETEKEVDYTILNEVIVSKVLEETAIVSFYVKCSNEEFAKALAKCFEGYLLEEAKEKVSQLESLEYLGGTTITEKNFNSKGAMSPKKGAALSAIIGFVFSACVVLVFVLFKPAVASKKYYEEYGVSVLDDAAEHKKFDYAYAADSIMKVVGENNFKSVVAVTTLSNKGFTKKFSGLLDKLREKTDADYTIDKATRITKEFSQLELVKKADAVIIVEEKGRTIHADLENTLSLLKKYDIPVAGIVLI